MGKEKTKHWYDNELKTYDGEVILQRNEWKAYGNEYFSGKTPLYYKNESVISFLITEILYYYICLQLDVKALEVRPALGFIKSYDTLSLKEGIVSLDFLSTYKNADFMSMVKAQRKSNTLSHNMKNNLEDIEIVAKELERTHNKPVKIDWDEVKNHMIATLIMDFLALNTDRHQGNMGIIVDYSNNDFINISMPPIYDNSLSFGFASCRTELLMLIFAYTKGNGQVNYEGLFNDNEFIGIIKNNINIFHEEGVDKREKTSNLSSVVKLINSHPYAFTLWRKAKKVDFDLIEKQIQQDMPNLKYRKHDFEIIKAVFKFQIIQVQEALNQINIANNANILKEIEQERESVF